MRNTPTVVITHHTGGADAQPLADSSNATVQDVDSWHKQRWPGFISRAGWHVGYHYFIDKSGTITRTRNHDEEGAHCIGMNRSSIGVCFAGNFDLTLPTPSQLAAWEVVYKEISDKWGQLPTFPHRKYATKTCHGRRLSDDYFVKLNQITTLKQRVKQLQAQLLALVTGRRMV